MYKLYDMNSRTILDISPNEIDIIHTINEELKYIIMYKQNINFLVMYYENEEPITIQIHTYEDFINYIDNFRKRNPEFNKKRVLKNENNNDIL